jgi:hypothetical protein
MRVEISTGKRVSSIKVCFKGIVKRITGIDSPNWLKNLAERHVVAIMRFVSSPTPKRRPERGRMGMEIATDVPFEKLTGAGHRAGGRSGGMTPE